jgi:hypothetical protein
MTKLIQETFEQILQLSEEQQDTLASYLQKHLIELLEKSEKEKRIAEHNYTLNEGINPLTKRQFPPVSIAVKGKTLGDLVSSIVDVDEEDGECLRE